MFDAYGIALDDPEPAVFRNDGDALNLMQNVAPDLTVTYRWPYLAHSCMEPMNCTALFHEGQLTVWAPSQALSTAQKIAAETAKLDRSRPQS